MADIREQNAAERNRLPRAGEDWTRAPSADENADSISERVALRNALIPVITTAGLQIGGLIGGALIVEDIFSLPGMGSLIVNAVYDRDFPLVQSALFIVVILLSLVNLVVDLTYAFIDPRIRFGS